MHSVKKTFLPFPFIMLIAIPFCFADQALPLIITMTWETPDPLPDYYYIAVRDDALFDDESGGYFLMTIRASGEEREGVTVVVSGEHRLAESCYWAYKPMYQHDEYRDREVWQIFACSAEPGAGQGDLYSFGDEFSLSEGGARNITVQDSFTIGIQDINRDYTIVSFNGENEYIWDRVGNAGHYIIHETGRDSRANTIAFEVLDANQEEEECIDDDGDDQYNKGVVFQFGQGRFWHMRDICFKDHWDADRRDEESEVLIEQVCNGYDIAEIEHDCSADGKICYDGECSDYCHDTDGRDAYAFGNVQVVDPDDENRDSFSDHCIKSNDDQYPLTVEEWQCSGNTPFSEEIRCGEGEACFEGRCMGLWDVHETTCSGNYEPNVFTPGRVSFYRMEQFVTLEQNDFVDVCNGEGHVIEHYCSGYFGEDAEMVTETLPCPDKYGCFEGRCIEIESDPMANLGDVNGDGNIAISDLSALQEMVDAAAPYLPQADIDMDGIIDSYDIYRLSRYLENPSEGIDLVYPVRELLLSTRTSFGPSGGRTIFYPADFVPGRLTEESSGRTWQIEYKQKGNSRGSCIPPVLNLKFPKRDLFNGISSYENYDTLGYRKLRLIPECDIWHDYEAGVILREYFIYKLFRAFGVPAVDVTGFANIIIDSPDAEIQPLQQYPYMLLQRDNEEDDQIPFMHQYRLSSVYESDSYYMDGGYDNNRFYEVAVRATLAPATQDSQFLHLDPDTAIRYFLLTSFTSLGDRSVLWNEDYGYSYRDSNWKHIPFDFDISFECSFNANDVEDEIDGLPEGIQQEYRGRHYAIAREIFDNPENLHKMLFMIDQFPFRDNKQKIKNTVRFRFYYYALYFGAPSFAERMLVPYVPYAHLDEYLSAAREIAGNEQFDKICQGEYHYLLQDVALLYSDHSNAMGIQAVAENNRQMRILLDEASSAREETGAVI